MCTPTPSYMSGVFEKQFFIIDSFAEDQWNFFLTIFLVAGENLTTHVSISCEYFKFWYVKYVLDIFYIHAYTR